LKYQTPFPARRGGFAARRPPGRNNRAHLRYPGGQAEKPGKEVGKVKVEVMIGKMQVDFLLVAILHIDKALVSR
jgi:hypothetical protein